MASKLNVSVKVLVEHAQLYNTNSISMPFKRESGSGPKQEQSCAISKTNLDHRIGPKGKSEFGEVDNSQRDESST